jgi:hypothetical protein
MKNHQDIVISWDFTRMLLGFYWDVMGMSWDFTILLGFYWDLTMILPGL